MSIRYNDVQYFSSAISYFDYTGGEFKNYVLETINPKRDVPFPTYFSSKKSIMNVDGFPTTVGSLSVDPHIAATIHPAPEN